MAGPLGLRARLYLRFAAILFSALSLAELLGVADMAALLLLPLGSAALLISAMAHFGKALPILPACLVLVTGLAGGLGAVVSGYAMMAVLPMMIASLLVVLIGLNRVALMPVLAGGSLLASGLAFVEQGAHAGVLLFCAATLMGLAKPKARPMASGMGPLRRQEWG